MAYIEWRPYTIIVLNYNSTYFKEQNNKITVFTEQRKKLQW